jgi:hypothetical protein
MPTLIEHELNKTAAWVYVAARGLIDSSSRPDYPPVTLPDGNHDRRSLCEVQHTVATHRGVLTASSQRDL